ncbi:MAG: hypothetical protein UX13_C0015G0009 [Candidatus Woesebacteria bacterium GW2011_GWB1_45_5]|uniref:Uncharacterized protein n=1 Tax=Candidatus Woesebacteria bacterium GW2011_GWB1_45_5 TaxID=1618581 RepID=A0A0G1QNT1_9BACT|nr:MAG: hypothetical protein UX13_C0015G0009 [Candidatus Woesebacteria bacterium GW2011_GWB1_45_5]
MLASTPGVIGTTLASDNPPTPPEVLGQTVSGGNAFDIQKALRIYLYFLGFYLLAKAYQRREDLVIPAATKFRTILLRLNSLLT